MTSSSSHSGCFGFALLWFLPPLILFYFDLVVVEKESKRNHPPSLSFPVMCEATVRQVCGIVSSLLQTDPLLSLHPLVEKKKKENEGEPESARCLVQRTMRSVMREIKREEGLVLGVKVERMDGTVCLVEVVHIDWRVTRRELRAAIEATFATSLQHEHHKSIGWRSIWHTYGLALPKTGHQQQAEILDLGGEGREVVDFSPHITQEQEEEEGKEAEEEKHKEGQGQEALKEEKGKRKLAMTKRIRSVVAVKFIRLPKRKTKSRTRRKTRF